MKTFVTEENSSFRIRAEMLSSIIQLVQNTGLYTITCLVANQDLTELQSKLNLNAGNVVSYTSTSAGTVAAFSEMNAATRTYFDSRAKGATSVTNFYSPENGNK